MLYNMRNPRISVAGARKDFANLLSRAAKRGTRIKVTRYGTTLAGIISRADLARLEECDETLDRRGRAAPGRVRGTRGVRARKAK